MSVTAIVSSGDEEEDQRREFEKQCARYGFNKENYGTKFLHQGKEYRFVGFDTHNRKNVCIISDTKSNTTFVCSTEFVKKKISGHVEIKCDCEHCKNAVCKTGAYTGTHFIECGLLPDEEYYVNHPEELKWAATHPEEAEKKYCSFVKGTPRNGGVTFDD